MAFIRNYSRRHMGDPLFGIKLKLPKIKPLKLLAGAASFVPGPVGVLAKVGKLSKVLGVAKTVGKIAAGGAAFGAGTSIAERALQGGFAGPAQPAPTWGPAGLNGSGGGSVVQDPLTGQMVRVRKRYRRMNVTNMKALTRASRRVHRFAKLARTCIVQAKHVRCPKKGSRGRKTC